jgi:predicted RNA-binding Zn-ribbon protein involved in translation (DUF1610 family)
MSTFNCLNCGKEHSIKRTHRNKFCDNVCQANYQFEQTILPRFHKGEVSIRRTLHRCLKHLHGYKCVECNNDGTYNGKALSLQLDHIDGDAGNNMPDNLRLLCPNCHSQTITFVAKNKGKGRQARGLCR